MRFSSPLKLLAASVALCLTAAFCISVVRAQETNPLAGKWKMVSTTDDGSEVRWNLSISYQDGKYSATSSADDGEAAVKELKVDGTKLHFRVPYQGDEYDIDLTLVGNKLSGNWSGNGASGDTKGEKVVPAEH